MTTLSVTHWEQKWIKLFVSSTLLSPLNQRAEKHLWMAALLTKLQFISVVMPLFMADVTVLGTALCRGMTIINNTRKYRVEDDWVWIFISSCSKTALLGISLNTKAEGAFTEKLRSCAIDDGARAELTHTEAMGKQGWSVVYCSRETNKPSLPETEALVF